MQKYNSRKEVPDEYKWDLTDLYPDFDKWNKDISKLPKMIKKLEKYKGHLLDSSESLFNYFKESEKTENLIEKLEFYAFLRSDVDLTDSDAQKYFGLIGDIIGNYNSTTSFVEPELISSSYSIIEEYLKEKPELKEYELLLKRIFRMKDHLLTPREEALFAEFTNITDNFDKSSQFIRDKEMILGTIADEDGKEVELNPSNIYKYINSKDRRVRKEVNEAEIKGYMNSIDSLTTNYLGFVKMTEMNAKNHNYKSYLEQKLFKANINRKVYDSLKKVAKENIGVYQKYLKFIKDILGYEKLESYDLNAPLVSTSDKEYSIEEARNMLENAFSFYGDDYMKAFNYAFDKKCIDFMPCKNKITGWYSAYIPCVKPRVFCNYNGKIIDISCLAHELGHFVNQFKIVTTQPPQYTYQSTFCAEVSSLNNEIVFSNKIMEISDDIELKKELLANFIKTFASNFFGAMRQALFEEECHNLIIKGEALSSKDLCSIWININKEFNGTYIENNNPIGWATIPHFYMGGGFYTYNYSTGIVAACNLADKLLNNEKGIKEKFLNYLTIGNSLDPIESLKTLGISMDTEKPYQVAIKMFEKAIDDFYNLMNS